MASMELAPLKSSKSEPEKTFFCHAFPRKFSEQTGQKMHRIYHSGAHCIIGVICGLLLDLLDASFQHCLT